MRRYKNILVAVDGSEASFHALAESIRLAQWGKGGATVIHVAPFYEGDLSLVGVKNIKATVNGLGGPILQEATNIAELHKFSINSILARGEIHEGIAQHALEEDVDLIVLGARKTSFIEGLFAGRVLREVIGLSSKDVLVIPDQATIGWDKVLFPNRQLKEQPGCRPASHRTCQDVWSGTEYSVGHESLFPCRRQDFGRQRTPF